MISWTLKLTKKFKDSKIEIKTMVDSNRTRQYNVICVDNTWAINYNDNGPVSVLEINDGFKLENIIEVLGPR